MIDWVPRKIKARYHSLPEHTERRVQNDLYPSASTLTIMAADIDASVQRAVDRAMAFRLIDEAFADHRMDRALGESRR